VFFSLNFLAATQDIAVDGWALTMLKRFVNSYFNPSLFYFCFNLIILQRLYFDVGFIENCLFSDQTLDMRPPATAWAKLQATSSAMFSSWHWSLQIFVILTSDQNQNPMASSL